MTFYPVALTRNTSPKDEADQVGRIAKNAKSLAGEAKRKADDASRTAGAATDVLGKQERAIENVSQVSNLNPP